jgi:acetoin utilization deacetylase AcuC-like enzyme
MVHLFTDPRMIDHAPPPGHPERPERLRAILQYLDDIGQTASCPAGTVRAATDEELLRVHAPELLELVAATAGRAISQVEVDTWTSTGSALAARLAAGAAVEAVRFVLGEPGRRALCLVRPPGHHARPAQPMGFCLFNHIAVAAAEARDRFELNRVLIVDFDVHHGNGTQEIFYADPRVAFFSIHRYPFYPGTGAQEETGTGPGLGFTMNLPIRFGTPRAAYHETFRRGLEMFAARVRPELVLISAGFDAHADDPIGGLGLENQDFRRLTREIVAVAETHARGRIVSVLEGGYELGTLPVCVALHLEALKPPAASQADHD